jgi:hypothetical protein
MIKTIITIADAIHNLSDALVLMIALLARKMARRPADESMTFGYGRTEVKALLQDRFGITHSTIEKESPAKACSNAPVIGHWRCRVARGGSCTWPHFPLPLARPCPKETIP